MPEKKSGKIGHHCMHRVPRGTYCWYLLHYFLSWPLLANYPSGYDFDSKSLWMQVYAKRTQRKREVISGTYIWSDKSPKFRFFKCFSPNAYNLSTSLYTNPFRESLLHTCIRKCLCAYSPSWKLFNKLKDTRDTWAKYTSVFHSQSDKSSFVCLRTCAGVPTARRVYSRQ